MFVENPSKKFHLITLVMLMFAAGAFASNNKELSGEVIKNIRSDFRMNTQTRAMYNAISNTDIKSLALNRDLLRDHNEFYSNKIKIKTVTNQRSSGRCWLFATLNILRPQIIEKNKLDDFQFSHIYLSFWDKMEKANTFYERIIRFRQRKLMDREVVSILRNPISDGGYWENGKDLIAKYGVVPNEVMPETNSSNSTKVMNKILERKLRVDATKLRKMAERGMPVGKLRKAKERMLGEVYRILVMNLGQPPVKFDWRYQRKAKKDDAKKDEGHKDKSIVIKDYTPKQFYDEFVGLDLDEYVDLANAAPHKLSKLYQVSLTRNIIAGHDLGFANVSMEAMKSIAIKSIKDGSVVWFSADVGVNQNSTKGIMADSLYDYETLFGINLKMSRAELALYRQSAPTHAMSLTGVDIQDDKPVKWLVENSWGKDRGNKGFWTMYDDWFDTNVFSVIVKKKYVPKNVLEIFEQDPIILPVWDPIW